MEEKEIKLKISPKYNFIYELGMPTGRKTKNALISLIISIVLLIMFDLLTKYQPNLISENIKGIIAKVILIVVGVLFLKLLAHIIAQILQYKYISYTFYDDYLEYKDSFLNQKTKIFKYENIQEVEIRRTIWDRINGLGMIILYTNAEKKTGSGLVIYAIKNTENMYNTIQELIYTCSKKNNERNEKENRIEEKIEYDANPEQSFKDKLRNI